MLADGMRMRGIEPHDAAHFLMKLMFCMFAEDIGLLGEERGSDVAVRTVCYPASDPKLDPAELARSLKALFER